MLDWGLYSIGINTIELGVLAWLLIHLRHSSAPYQAALIEELRKEHDILRRNFSSMNSEYITDRNDTLQGNNRIWEELRRINARLDMMRCPMKNVECPLNHKLG